MHRGNHGTLSSVHRNPQRCRDERFLDFRAWSMRTLFSCLKCFRPVVQTLYPHNSLRSLSLHFYVTNCSKRIGRRLCSACADQENKNVVSSPLSNSGPQCGNDPYRLQGKHGFFQPEKKPRKFTVNKARAGRLDRKTWECLRWFLILIRPVNSTLDQIPSIDCTHGYCARLQIKRSGFEPWPGTLSVCSWARYFTLTVPLSLCFPPPRCIMD